MPSLGHTQLDSNNSIHKFQLLMFPTNPRICFSLKANPDGVKTSDAGTGDAPALQARQATLIKGSLTQAVGGFCWILTQLERSVALYNRFNRLNQRLPFLTWRCMIERQSIRTTRPRTSENLNPCLALCFSKTTSRCRCSRGAHSVLRSEGACYRSYPRG